MRDNLRDFLQLHAGSDEQQLALLRSLCPRIWITGAHYYNALHEVVREADAGSEFIGDDLPPPEDALKCISIRPFRRGVEEGSSYELTNRIADHLRALKVGAEGSLELDLLRQTYIEEQHASLWKAAAQVWRAVSPSTEAAATQGQPEEARASEAIPLKRAALVAAHKTTWPTIEADLKDASKNGLSDAAKVGHRGWNEARALEWARANKKVPIASEPQTDVARALHGMSGLPRRTHRLSG